VKQRLLIWLIPRLIKQLIALLSFSVRWQIVGTPYNPEQPARHIFAFWHGRLLMMGTGLKGCRGYTLISEHRDGGYISDTLNLQGFRTIRGSSTRGGARALLQMVRAYRAEHCDFGITPDGPKGPREVVQMGTIQLALKTGLPVLPVCWATNRHWRINSWDRFYIPKPFSRGVFIMGEPIVVSPNDDLNLALQRVQQAMDGVQHRADSYFDDNKNRISH